MTENDRVRQVRKSKNLTLEKFGAALGVQKSAISKIERGENSVSEQIHLAICREFNVSEQWLRTGEGEMFIKKNNGQEIAAFIGDVLSGEPDFRQRFISVLSRMEPDEWKLLEKKVLELVDEFKSHTDPAAETKISREQMEAAEETAPEIKTPTPVSEDGLEAEKKKLKESLDKMNPVQLQMYFDQMRRLKVSQTEALSSSAPLEADKNTPESIL